MGSSQSLLKRPVSVQHKRKVDPLLRANHKHVIHLASPPHPEYILNPTSQVLSAACALEVIPTSVLFDLWDELSHDTIDVDDATSEIVETDYLSPSTLGHVDESTRYVDYFDDELVRHLYDYEKLVRHYLKQDHVVDGLVSSKSCAWGVRQLACAIEMESKEMCTEALGCALAFYEPLASQDKGAERFESEADLVRARDELIETTLSRKVTSMDVLDELIVLHSIAILWPLAPDQQFQRLWAYQTSKLENLNDSEIPLSIGNGNGLDDDWNDCLAWVSKQDPLGLPRLRILKEYPKYGFPIAQAFILDGRTT